MAKSTTSGSQTLFERGDGALIAPPNTSLQAAKNLSDLGSSSSASKNLLGFTVLQPSGDSTGVADAANITTAVAAIPSQGGMVMLAPSAQWYIACGNLTIARSGVYLYAPGTYINAVGTGDVIRMYDTTNTWPVYGGGILGFPVIDGTSAGAGSAGVHMGDLLQGVCEVFVQNFSGSGSIGVHFDNASYWTEQLRARVYAQGCKTGVIFDVTGATTSTNSFARADVQIYIDQATASFDGVTFQNGAYLYDGAFVLRGNFNGSSGTLSSGVLRMTGTVPAGHPGAGSNSCIVQSRVEIGVEVGSAAHTPTTIVWGGGSNLILNCYGIMDFAGGPGTFATASSSTNLYPFNGSINGDTTLAAASGFSGAQKFGGTQTFTGQVVIENSGAAPLIVSPDGTTTSAGAFVVDVSAAWFGVYATSNSMYYGISYALPAPAGVAAVGGYYKGLGIGGTTNGGTNPIFGVLNSAQSGNGLGNTAFTVQDGNQVYTYRNTLDDGSGNMSVFALLTLHFGSNTANYAPALTPTFANGTAAQLSDTARDYMVYLAATTSGTATTVAIGPTSTPANTILPSSSVTAGQMISFRLPAGWYVQWAGTTTAFATQTAIGC